MDLVQGLERLTLLRVDWDGTVHLLHSFLSLLVVPYTIDQRLLAFFEELPSEGLPPVTEIPVDAFLMRRVVRAIMRDNHHVHVEGVPPPCWQLMLCKRAGKLKEDTQYIAFWGLTFGPLNGVSCLLGRGAIITEAS